MVSPGIPRGEVKVILGDVPIDRVLEPEEVADISVYLASDLARDIKEPAILIDKGCAVSFDH